MRRLQWSFDAVTSLVRFYGFSDKGDRTVETLEECLKQKVYAHNPDGRGVDLIWLKLHKVQHYQAARTVIS